MPVHVLTSASVLGGGASERRSAYEEMNALLRSRAGEIEEKLSAETETMLRHRWEVGEIVADVKQNQKVYGTERASMKLLAQYLGINKTILEHCERFHNEYNQKDLEDLLTARMTDGRPLTWTHVVELLRIDSPTSRKKLQEMTLNRSWSTDQLTTEVDLFLRQGKRSVRSAAGRPPDVPASTLGHLTNIFEATSTWLRRDLHAWSDDERGLQRRFHEMPRDQIDQTLLNQVKETHDALQDLVMHAAAQLRLVDNVRNEVERTLTARHSPLDVGPIPKRGAAPPSKEPENTPDPQYVDAADDSDES